MSFNPDPNKQATEVSFSRKVNSDDHPTLIDFNRKLDKKINKCNKRTGMMKKLSSSVSEQSLLTIYISFVRTILDYADIIYDKPH